MNIVKIYEICGDKNQMLEKLVEWGLIPQSGTYNCMDCGQALKLRSEEDRVDGFRWTCHGNKKTQNKKKAKRCDKRVGFRTGTFFARSHLPIWKILGFVNFWVQGASLRLTGLQLELAQEALVDWSSFCREVILASYFGRLEKIGGPGKIVEIDESKFEISIKFKGRGSTSWSETTRHKDSNGKTVSRTTHYSGDEEYFATSIYLIRPSSGDEMELPAGKHTYPFSFTLPNSLPSSFEGSFGFIRYTIKSTLNRPWKFNMDTKLPFTIISHLDLNSDPDYKLPIHIHLKKHYGCFCCKSGPLLLDFNLPVSGYCSGQAIPIDVSCENGSNVHIHNFKVELRKTVKFHSKTPRHKTKTEKSLIAELSLGQLAANSSKDWREYMQVPELPPSNLEDCGIIDLDYNIKITCIPSGCHANSDEKKTIILGTVPFVGFDCLPPGPPPVPMQAPEVSNWQSKAEFPLLPSLTPMLPPPIMQQLPFPSAPMMPQSGLGPDPNLFPYPPYDAPPPFQGQSSMGIVHGEKNWIASTPQYQGDQSSMGITQDGNNKIISPPPLQGGQSSMVINHGEKNSITSPPPFQGQSSMGIIQDENNRITSPPPYQGGQSSMGIIHQDGIDHNARISPTGPPPTFQDGESSTGMTQDEIDHQNRIGIPPPYSSFAGYSYPYQ